MPHKKIGPGFRGKLDGRIVSFRQRTTVELGKNKDSSPVLASIPEGTVGILTGGFVNEIDERNRLRTKIDVKVALLRGHGRITLIVSVPLEVLQSGTKLEIE